MSNKLIFRLYIDSEGPSSIAAKQNLESLIKSHNLENYEREIVDINVSPDLAIEDKIIAIPTLCITNNDQKKKIIGDLSDLEQVSISIGL